MTISGLLMVIIVVFLALYLIRLVVDDLKARRFLFALVGIVVLIWLLDGLGVLGKFNEPIRFR